LRDDDLLSQAAQPIVVTVPQLGPRHFNRDLMVRYHQGDELAIGADRLGLRQCETARPCPVSGRAARDYDGDRWNDAIAQSARERGSGRWRIPHAILARRDEGKTVRQERVGGQIAQSDEVLSCMASTARLDPRAHTERA
jgi:hypothetical protein